MFTLKKQIISFNILLQNVKGNKAAEIINANKFLRFTNLSFSL